MFDFGRNDSLVRSANSRAKSVEQTAEAIRAQIVFQVDRAYFTTLRAQALLKVAEQTVTTRQVVVDQTKELQKSGIKSGLDVSVADYSLAESKLLLVRAQNDLRSAFADLSAAIGSSAEQTFELVDEYFPLKKPSVSAVWNAGVVPFRDKLLGSRYNAAGLTITIPVFNGRLFKAREAEAEYKARASDEQLKDMENRIVRDVRVAWLNADNAYQRIELGSQLLNRARESLSLAQQRYRMGLSSIVELTQALLSVTVAEIETANARFEYLLQRSALNYQTGQLR
jgi:outer membrane protein